MSDVLSVISWNNHEIYAMTSNLIKMESRTGVHISKSYAHAINVDECSLHNNLFEEENHASCKLLNR